MDKDSAFKEVQNNIAKGNTAAVRPQVMKIASDHSDDAITLLTCASLLKTVDDDEGSESVIKMLMDDLPPEESARLEIAKGLNGLGYSGYASDVLKDLAVSDDIQRMRMTVAYDLGDHELSVHEYDLIQEPAPDDDIAEIDALCALGRFKEADEKSIGLLSRENNYQSQRERCSVLLRSGRQKDAEKFVKDILKNDKRSADANALAAYFMWMNNKISAAGGYATKAVKADPTHIGAMEILALCLIEKGKINEAKIVAGAINEQAPGHKAVIRILSMCRQ